MGSAARRWREPKDLLFASFTHHENGCPRQLLFASFTHHENGCPRRLLFASFSHHETGCPRAVAFRALHPPRNWVPPGSCFSRPSPTTKLGAPGPSPLGTGDRTNPTQEALVSGHERGARPVGVSQSQPPGPHGGSGASPASLSPSKGESASIFLNPNQIFRHEMIWLTQPQSAKLKVA